MMKYERPGATMPAYDFESAKAVRIYMYRYMCG